MRTRSRGVRTVVWLAAAILACGAVRAESDVWQQALRHKADHIFSTLFEAPTVTKELGSEAGIDRAIDWCKRSAVTKVYIESFRNGHLVERNILERAKVRFLEAGLEVSGGITTLGLGRRSTGWKLITCFTDTAAQERTKEVFEYTARLFDEIMIDDFWFTDCSCEECDRARRERRVTLGGRTTTAAGGTWEDYRRELMVRLSREYVLAAGRAVNPKVKQIIKYPQWYDRFHERGYDVELQSADFDRIWVGTESRDRDKTGKVQYEGYFIMRWLEGIGGKKTGGGWFDPYQTSPPNYIEQARQTVLGGARETVLFCYGALTRPDGARNLEALRPHIPGLLEAARQVRRRQIVGVAAYKPANSHPEKEAFVYDFVGMLGVPLVPCHEFPVKAQAAFFPVHVLKDPQFVDKFERFLRAGKQALITDGLAEQIKDRVRLERPTVHILPVNGKPEALTELPEEQVEAFRKPLLEALKVRFRAPNQVALYLFRDGSWAIENFLDRAVEADYQGRPIRIAARDWVLNWR